MQQLTRSSHKGWFWHISIKFPGLAARLQDRRAREALPLNSAVLGLMCILF